MRIRTIKPQFWEDSKIAQHDYFTRLLFIGLWNYVDDNGVGLDDEALIAGKLFAQDFYQHPDDIRMRIHGGLTELSLSTQIKRYFDGKHHLLCIVNWDKHQNINRPSKSDYKRPEELPENVAIIEEPNLFTADSVSTHGGLSGGIGKREEGIGNKDKDMSNPNLTVRSYSSDFETFWSEYPVKDGKKKAYEAFRKAIRKINLESLIAAVRKYRNWLDATGTKPKFAQGWLNDERWNDSMTIIPQQHAGGQKVSQNRMNLQHNQQVIWDMMTDEEKASVSSQSPLGLEA